MKPYGLLTALIMAIFSLSHSAWALDRMILITGKQIEGKIEETDSESEHYEFVHVDGTKERIPFHWVVSHELDVPSELDQDINNNRSDLLLSPSMGLAMQNRSTGSSPHFSWGARLAVNSLSFRSLGRLAFGISYHHTTSRINNTTLYDTVGELLFQVMFRKMFSTGFYLGPEFGLGLLSQDITIFRSTAKFSAGIITGYEFYLLPSFSVGPEIHFTVMNHMNVIKGLVGTSFHL